MCAFRFYLTLYSDYLNVGYNSLLIVVVME